MLILKYLSLIKKKFNYEICNHINVYNFFPKFQTKKYYIVKNQGPLFLEYLIVYNIGGLADLTSEQSLKLGNGGSINHNFSCSEDFSFSKLV